MTDTNWPATSLAQGPCAVDRARRAVETQTILVHGQALTVWKHVPATAAELFAKARSYGAREFLVLEDERVTYDGFVRAVTALAADLHARGLRKGDRVALAMRNLPEWPVVLMATLLNGAIVVPLNAWWTVTELPYGILDSGVRFVFADGERFARLGDLPPSVEQVFVTARRGTWAPGRHHRRTKGLAHTGRRGIARGGA